MEARWRWRETLPDGAARCGVVLQALAAVLLVLNRIQGMRTSGVIFMFWALHAAFGALTTRTHINRILQEQVTFLSKALLKYSLLTA